MKERKWKEEEEENERLEKSEKEPSLLDLDVLGSGINQLTLKQAHHLVDNLPNYFIPVGSVVRGKENPKDIDLISTRPLNEAYKFFEKNYDVTEVRTHGPKRSDFVISYDGDSVPINLWYSDKDNLGIKKLLLDYPKGLIIGIRRKLKKFGYHLSEDKLYKGDEEITIKDPKEIFEYADIVYRTPEQEHKKRLKK